MPNTTEIDTCPMCAGDGYLSEPADECWYCDGVGETERVPPGPSVPIDDLLDD